MADEAAGPSTQRDPANLPSGTVAFLFTDIAGSTRVLAELGSDAYAMALMDHRQILRDAFGRWHGTEIDTQGDSFFVVFRRVSEAVECAVDAQVALAAHPWPAGESISVRMGVHAGEALSHQGSYVGMEVHRGARVAAAGYGGQILLSGAAAELVRGQLPEGTALLDLGKQALKDLPAGERVFQLTHPRLQAIFPPLKTAVSLAHLPAQASAFIGREDQISRIGEVLNNPDVRLVTLTGPGGAGKTRLALRIAETTADRYRDGVFFVDLAPAQETTAVLALIIQALGETLPKEQSPDELLKRLLSDTRTLLVLDNFEQVTAAGTAVADLLEASTGLSVLVTSREPLHIRAEHVFPVQPMTLPPADFKTSDIDLATFEGIQLFVDRARAVKPDFQMTDENASAIVEICRRLDGLPLAIELATARLRLFSPEGLRDRLSRNLDLLKGGPRDLPARQQTIRDTIEWSYQLLEPAEQQLFEILAVFATADLDAIEHVVATTNDAIGGSVESLDGIASLLDKSLLRSLAQGTAERIGMLETIREYAAERLRQRPNLRTAARRAHAQYYASLTAGGDRRSMMLSDDMENLRSAWLFGVEQGDLELLESLNDGLTRAYQTLGLYRATIEQATELLRVHDALPSNPAREARSIELQFMRFRSMLVALGYTTEVERAGLEAIELFENKRVDAAEMFPLLRFLAGFYQFRTEFDKSRAMAERLLRLAQDRGDGEMAASASLLLATSANFEGDLKGSDDHFNLTLAWYAAHPPAPSTRIVGVHTAVAAHNASALNLHLLGFPDQALTRAHRGIELAKGLGHPHSLAYAHYHTGFLYLWRQEPEMIIQQGREVFDAIGTHEIGVWRALGHVLIGAANVSLGAVEEGIAQLETALEAYKGLRTPPLFWPFLQLVRATAFGQAGRLEEAMHILEEASSLPAYGEMPHFKLARGYLLLARPEAREARKASAYFRAAYDASAQAGILMTKLQAAIALRRFGLASGLDEGLTELRSTYNSFTEGFAIPDLVAARELLQVPE